MITIGCDPGKRTGIVVWRDERCVFAREYQHDATEYEIRLRAMRDVRDVLGRDVSALWVCEAQFLGRRKDDDDSKTLGRLEAAFKVADIATRYEELAYLFGYDVAPRIYPSSWRSLFGLASPAIEHKAAEAVKLVRQRVELFNGRRVSEHVAEAALIGLAVHARRYERTGTVPHTIAWALLGQQRRRNDKAHNRKRGRGQKGRGARHGRA